jgi:hypothetical protein
MITIDPKSLWKTLLTTGLTLIMGLLGWLASVAWDQQVSNTRRIETLELEKAVLSERLTTLQGRHEGQMQAVWRRLNSLNEKNARQHPSMGK